MRTKPAILSALSALTLATALVAAPVWSQDTDPVMRISTPFPFTRLDPVLEGGNYYVFGAAELLMRFEETGAVVPWVLEGLESVDDLT